MSTIDRIIAIGIDALAADGHYIVIDKSNAGDVFPHNTVDKITIKDVGGYILGLASANVKIEIGVITAFATTVSSTIKWLAAEAAIAAGERVKFKDVFPGFNLTPELDHVSSGGAGSTLYETGNTDYRDTITTHKTPFDATGSTIGPAIGDVVMSVTVTAGTCDIDLWLKYDT